MIWGALALPAILLLTGGALDVASVVNDRERLRQVAEGAALSGARDLGLATGSDVAIARATNWAEDEMNGWRNQLDAVVSAREVELSHDRRGLEVTITASRPSMFGRILPPGGWKIAVAATAAPSGSVPLCVLATQSSKSKVINVKDEGVVRAPGCSVHSNRDIVVEGSGVIESELITAVTEVDGADGVQDAPAIVDPFADIVFDPPSCLPTTTREYRNGTFVLPAGTHCGKIDVHGTAVLRLEPGEHWFVHADFHAKENARVEGDDVVLIFDRDSKFKFDDRARIRLTGREDGDFAGFVLAATRDNRHDFIITSDSVESLLGVIYVPNAQLIIEGKAEVARESAWTVLVAQTIQLKGNPTLFVNANYRAADVPVPDGVGPRANGPVLVN